MNFEQLIRQNQQIVCIAINFLVFRSCLPVGVVLVIWALICFLSSFHLVLGGPLELKQSVRDFYVNEWQ